MNRYRCREIAVTDTSRLKVLRDSLKMPRTVPARIWAKRNDAFTLFLLTSIALTAASAPFTNYSACVTNQKADGLRVRRAVAELRFRAERIAQVHQALSAGMTTQGKPAQKRWVQKMKEVFDPDRNFFIQDFKGKSIIDLALTTKIIIEDWGIRLEDWGKELASPEAAKPGAPMATLYSFFENLIETGEMLSEHFPDAGRRIDVPSLSKRLDNMSSALMSVPRPGDSYIPISCLRRTLGLS